MGLKDEQIKEVLKADVKKSIAFFQNEVDEFKKSLVEAKEKLSGFEIEDHDSDEYSDVKDEVQYFQEFVKAAAGSLAMYQTRYAEITK